MTACVLICSVPATDFTGDDFTIWQNDFEVFIDNFHQFIAGSTSWNVVDNYYVDYYESPNVTSSTQTAIDGRQQVGSPGSGKHQVGSPGSGKHQIGTPGAGKQDFKGQVAGLSRENTSFSLFMYSDAAAQEKTYDGMFPKELRMELCLPFDSVPIARDWVQNNHLGKQLQKFYKHIVIVAHSAIVPRPVSA